MGLEKMSINLIGEVVGMWRNYVFLLENKCIERKLLKHNVLVGTCLRNMLFKSCFNF